MGHYNSHPERQISQSPWDIGPVKVLFDTLVLLVTRDIECMLLLEGLTAKWPAYVRFPIHNTL